ncbi:unnamed protein product, partial [Brenthis ino]
MYNKNIIVLLLCLLAYVSTAPTDVPPEKQQPTVIPIISQSEEFEPNGTYKFSYETGNGIKREEIAYEKVLPKARASSNEASENEDYSDEIHVQQGSYSYTAPDGTIISLRYIADENGFRPIGDHLPKSPVAIPASPSSAEKKGRALKTPDSSISASATVETKAKKSESIEPSNKPAESSPDTSASPVKVSSAPEEPAVVPENASIQETAASPAEPSANEENKPETKIEQAGEDNVQSPKIEQSATESDALKSSDATTPNVDVSSETASTPVPVQSTESEQGPTASAEQALTSTSEQPSTEVSEPQSSTTAPEQSSAIETVGQSAPTETTNRPSEEEAEQSTTKIPQSEESLSTTISN